ncbi:MAG TPA: DUF3794 domain-containing protein [Symbiobacteriaceae bacterium]|nr:DUF3794 domain-containing protein [Symbiobacteriaceae bacterium]
MSRFEVDRVIGSGSVEELICQTVAFTNTVEEIKEIRKTVIIDNCRVVFDKVIIDGRLRKDIMYKNASTGFPIPGTVQGCSGLLGTIPGPILDLDVEIAFTALIPVRGAKPGDRCVVIHAFVEGEKEEPANINAAGTFTALVDKSIVFLCVKVIRSAIADLDDDDSSDSSDEWDDDQYLSDCSESVRACGYQDHSGSADCSGSDHSDSSREDDDHDCDHDRKRRPHKRPPSKHRKPQDRKRHKTDTDLCPPRRSTGFFPGKIPTAQPGLIPGSWVGPTLVFQGVLNPGIPTLLPPANVPSATAQDNQIQITGLSTKRDC